MGFSIAMVSGCALEVVGYLGRILANQDMFSEVSARQEERHNHCHKQSNVV